MALCLLCVSTPHRACRPDARAAANPGAGFSAHFKIDESAGPDKRTLYNIGFGAVGPGLYDAFAMDEGLKLLRKGSVPLPWSEIAFVHDLCAHVECCRVINCFSSCLKFAHSWRAASCLPVCCILALQSRLDSSRDEQR